jgi:hypothetical protein
LIPEGFKFPIYGLVQATRRRCLSWNAEQTKRIGRKEGDNPARECLQRRGAVSSIASEVANSLAGTAENGDAESNYHADR